MSTFKLLIYLLSTSTILTGLIWTIQLVHYPSFFYIDEKDFKKFTFHHGKNITIVVAPLMIAELGLSILCFFYELNNLFIWLNFLSVIILWLITFFLMMPIHRNLNNKKDSQQICNLVRTNWSRTLIWTSRAGLICFYLLKVS